MLDSVCSGVTIFTEAIAKAQRPSMPGKEEDLSEPHDYEHDHESAARISIAMIERHVH